ncbi:hypothetical protein DERP_000130 [Dermatophagoides pteronyssinus]|uniref:Uncharacterized protein n=1 Tax=Dermatophagoides pteronyssinus TaxID=6956 RepID=A0ABQ8IZB0_DERPT|nr:hypothetical protein DERP_000130 [Dermatophagoides pteronyssinus]
MSFYKPSLTTRYFSTVIVIKMIFRKWFGYYGINVNKSMNIELLAFYTFRLDLLSCCLYLSFIEAFMCSATR